MKLTGFAVLGMGLGEVILITSSSLSSIGYGVAVFKYLTELLDLLTSSVGIC